MATATWAELELLFKRDPEQVNAFIEKHKEELEDLLDWLDDPVAEFDTVFSWVYGVAVDWREEEEAIIEYFNDVLDEDDSLTGECDFDTMKLMVDYNGIIHEIQLKESPADRYIAIRGLQDIISDKYAIKLFEESYMSDTHSFLILHKDIWERAGREFPAEVKKYFRNVTKTLDFP